MSLLRIRVPLGDATGRCQWALAGGAAATRGESTLAQVPRGAHPIQLVIPAAQLVLTRAQLPPSARRSSGSVLAYAVEEATVGEPDAVTVFWLGAIPGAAERTDALAVLDKAGLAHNLLALEAAGLGVTEIQCETLLLPWTESEWSLAWDGREGYVRSGLFEGGATDCGSLEAPPHSLRLMLEEARVRGNCPASIAVHVGTGCTPPDCAAWQQALGIRVNLAAPWEWQSAPADAGVAIAAPRRRWRFAPGALARLRPAAWIAAAALAFHAVALAADWGMLAREQGALRREMAAQFRATFPDAIAVVDPVLQMRRKLADARHAAGLPDQGDFLPMFQLVAAAAGDLQAGAPLAAAYENARLTLEFPAASEAGVRRLMARLIESGLAVELRPAPAGRPAGTALILTVRAS